MSEFLSIIEDEALLPSLTANTIQWGESKGILGPFQQPGKQLGKVKEEVGELSEAYWEYDSYGVNDPSPAKVDAYTHCLTELGDVLVTLTLLARQLGSTTSECLELAWDKIKGREGRLIDGVFVKAEDLNKA